MHIHPLFVHFPIALLMVYALLEVCGPILYRLLQTIKREAGVVGNFVRGELYSNIKAFLVIVGTLSVFPTLQTGEFAEHSLRDNYGNIQDFTTTTLGKLVEMHSSFATATAVVASILAVGYLLRLSYFSKYSLFRNISNIIVSPVIAWVLASAVLLLLTITGALGGAITHGPDTDPVVTLIYSWFF